MIVPSPQCRTVTCSRGILDDLRAAISAIQAVCVPHGPHPDPLPKGEGVDRRGFVLPVVLIIMTIALLIGTGMLFMTQAEAAGMVGSLQQAQSRALAWSGVQAVMNRLDDQRRRLLESDLPRVDEQYIIYEFGRRLGVARLLPLNGAGDRIIAENTKLDLNFVTAEMLVKTGLIDEELAAAIIAYREGSAGGVIQSEAELLRVPGMTPPILYGPLESMAIDADQADASRGTGFDGASGARAEDLPRGLADVVTVYGYEPALQRSGKRRINLNVPWSEELGRRVAQRWDENAATILKQIFDNGTKFDTEARIYQVLRFFSVPPEDWPDIIDALTADDSIYHFGRVNVNHAPREVLAAIPGLDDEAAAGIIQNRESLGFDERNTVAWLAINDVVPHEAYDDLAAWITTRSWTFRLRLAAGEVDADEPDGPLLHPVIYEVVIDLAAPRARVAYLRDISSLDTALRIAQRAEPDEDERDWESSLESDAAGEATTLQRPLHEFTDMHSFDRPGDPDDPAGDASRGRNQDDEWVGGESAGAGLAPDTAGSSAGTSAMPPGGGSDAAPRGRRVGRWRGG